MKRDTAILKLLDYCLDRGEYPKRSISGDEFKKYGEYRIEKDGAVLANGSLVSLMKDRGILDEKIDNSNTDVGCNIDRMYTLFFALLLGMDSPHINYEMSENFDKGILDMFQKASNVLYDRNKSIHKLKRLRAEGSISHTKGVIKELEKEIAKILQEIKIMLIICYSGDEAEPMGPKKEEER